MKDQEIFAHVNLVKGNVVSWLNLQVNYSKVEVEENEASNAKRKITG